MNIRFATGAKFFLSGAVGLAICCGAQAARDGASNSKETPAQSRPQDNNATTSKILPNGVEVNRGALRLQVSALRDDVLRIRLSPTGSLPEDASWAVAPEIRKQNAAAVTDNSANSAGFHTNAFLVN